MAVQNNEPGEQLRHLLLVVGLVGDGVAHKDQFSQRLELVSPRLEVGDAGNLVVG